MLKVEKKNKEDLYQSPWSIKLSNRTKHLFYWQLAVFRLLTKVSHSVRKKTIAAYIPSSYDISNSTVTDSYAKRRTIRKTLRQTIAQSYNLRRQHLIVRAAAFGINSDYKQGRAIKQLIIIENQQYLYTAIKHHFNLTFKSSLSKVQIPIDNEDWNNIPKDKSFQWKKL